MSSTDIFQLTILLLPTVVVCLVLVLRYLARLALLRLIGEAVAAEKPITREVLDVLTGTGRSAPERDRRRGVMLMAVGAGLALIGVCLGLGLASGRVEGAWAAAMAPIGVGVLPFCIGAAYFWLSRQQRG